MQFIAHLDGSDVEVEVLSSQSATEGPHDLQTDGGDPGRSTVANEEGDINGWAELRDVDQRSVSR